MTDFTRGLIWLGLMIPCAVLWARESERRNLRVVPGLIGLFVIGDVMVGIVWLATTL